MEAEPLLEALGVKVAVRVRPDPAMAEREPPETETSPVAPFHEKEVPGSSEKEKVMVAVCPAIKAAELLVIARVGGVVSVVGMVAPMPWLTISCASPAALFQTLKVPVPVMVPALLQKPSMAVKLSPALPVMSSWWRCSVPGRV